MKSLSPEGIVDMARSLGFKAEAEGDTVRVSIGETTLLITESSSHKNCAIGFENTPWHFHGDLMLMTGDSTFAQYGPAEVLKGLKQGHILVCERRIRSRVQDRWLCHKDERISFSDMEPGEELRILNIQSDRQVRYPRQSRGLEIA